MSEHARDELRELVRDAVEQAVAKHCRFSDVEAARLHLTAGMSQEQIEALSRIGRLPDSQLNALSRLARAVDSASDRIGQAVVIAMAAAAVWVIWKLSQAGIIDP